MSSTLSPFFRYPEDRLSVVLIVALCLCDFAVFFLVHNPFLVVIWVLLGVVPKVCICAWNHHHQHLPTFHSVFLNRLLEVVYTLHTGITTNAWVLHHVLGHHVNYLDQDRDESNWKTKSGRTMGAFEYTTRLAATGYVRAFQVGRRFPEYQRGMLAAGILTMLLVAALFYINWVNALLLFVIPMFVGYIATCWHTYYHHAGLDTENQFEASYNIKHKWYNILTGNLGFHTAHHVKPGLHWSRLPEYHKTIEVKIPAHLFKEPCIPFKWLPTE